MFKSRYLLICFALFVACAAAGCGPSGQSGEPEELPSGVPDETVHPGDTGSGVLVVRTYLVRYGYLSIPNDSPADHQDEVYDDVLKAAVELYQQYNQLAVTGDVDEPTLHLMQQPRCALPDILGDPANVPDPASYVLSGLKWPKHLLTYRFVNYTSDLPQSNLRSDVVGALSRWSSASPLTLAEGDASSEIQVSWAVGDHGDGYPFDGPGAVLAHAFYPDCSGSCGDIHFDDSESWTDSKASGIDLPTVALHEAGHALGLAHSPITSSAMYAYYSGVRREVTSDDIQGIRALYQPWLQAMDGNALTGDFNGDGLWDWMRWDPNPLGWTVCLSNGTAFTNCKSWLPNSADGKAITGDFNGDGLWDWMRWDPSPLGWTVCLSNGTAFANCKSWLPNASNGNAATGDFNGDGLWDWMRWDPNPLGWTVCLSNGTAFTNCKSWLPNSADGKAMSGDFNGDGLWDWIRWDPSPLGWTLCLSNGTSAFSNCKSWLPGAPNGTALVGDFDGDGLSDLSLFKGPDMWTVWHH